MDNMPEFPKEKMIELLVERLATIRVECKIRDSEINEWKFNAI